MRKIILLLMILTFSSSIGQTKQETLDWLNLKLKEYTDSFMGEYQVQIKNEPDWGETLVVSVRVANDYMEEHYKYYSVLPKNIASVVTTTEFRSDGKLGLKLIAKGKSIYMNKSEFVDLIEILCKPAPDETIIRMQKGFIHLLNLMGNPITTPKELFKE